MRRLIGDEPEGLGWATAVLQRMVDAAPGEGRALFSGLRGLLDSDELTDTGRGLREGIDDATDRMEARLVAALGSDAQRLFDLLDPWCDLIVADGGYPVRVTWPT